MVQTTLPLTHTEAHIKTLASTFIVTTSKSIKLVTYFTLVSTEI